MEYLIFWLKKILLDIQHDLFVLGAELANPKSLKDDKVLVKYEMISTIERRIDDFESAHIIPHRLAIIRINSIFNGWSYWLQRTLHLG